MVDFEAHPMRGTSFDIGDDDEEPLTRSNSSESMRSLEEISNMIEQITQRMKFYQDKYMDAKKSNSRDTMISSLRNFKALEGSRKSLRWVLKDSRANHPLF
jgi:hypothetical protein